MPSYESVKTLGPGYTFSPSDLPHPGSGGTLGSGCSCTGGSGPHSGCVAILEDWRKSSKYATTLLVEKSWVSVGGL